MTTHGYRPAIFLPGLSLTEVYSLVPATPILLAYRGSQAHGTYIPPEEKDSIDDVDIIGVYIPALSYYFGYPMKVARGRDIKLREWDSAAYELRHFVSLLANGNPNVLSALWVKDYLYLGDAAKPLLQMRHLFLTKKLYHSFCGYAYSQLKRMTAYKDSGEGTCCAGQMFHESDCKLAVERGRSSAKKFATGYMGEKRKALVEKFGYDCKNAAHLIRLLRMGVEVLEDGVVNVDRTGIDADELVAIKTGRWTLEQVQREAEQGFVRMQEAHLLSRLPEDVDEHSVNWLLQDILSEHFAADINIRVTMLRMNKER